MYARGTLTTCIFHDKNEQEVERISHNIIEPRKEINMKKLLLLLALPVFLFSTSTFAEQWKINGEVQKICSVDDLEKECRQLTTAEEKAFLNPGVSFPANLRLIRVDRVDFFRHSFVSEYDKVVVFKGEIFTIHTLKSTEIQYGEPKFSTKVMFLLVGIFLMLGSHIVMLISRTGDKEITPIPGIIAALTITFASIFYPPVLLTPALATIALIVTLVTLNGSYSPRVYKVSSGLFYVFALVALFM